MSLSGTITAIIRVKKQVDNIKKYLHLETA